MALVDGGYDAEEEEGRSNKVEEKLGKVGKEVKIGLLMQADVSRKVRVRNVKGMLIPVSAYYGDEGLIVVINLGVDSHKGLMLIMQEVQAIKMGSKVVNRRHDDFNIEDGVPGDV